MKLTHKRIATGAVALVIVDATVVQIVQYLFGYSRTLHAHQIQPGLTYLDTLIDSQSLSQLPRDVLRMPLLRDVLTEDSAAYYEGDEDRPSVAGVLHRLAYEQKLSLAGIVPKHVFNEPARMVLRRDLDDKLCYWALSIQRNGPVKTLGAVTTVATSDTQPTKVADGLGDSDTPVYTLGLSATHSILIASRGDQLITLSEPDISLDKNDKPISEQANTLTALFSDDAGKRNVWDMAYALPAQEPMSRHVVVGISYLSSGYQQCFPGIETLRFDSDSGRGSTGNGW